MADIAGTTEMLRPHLLDLSGVPLGELGGVNGLSVALTSLQRQLAHTAAPLCSGERTKPCGSELMEQVGSGHER
jgi:hypothetical protein